MLDHFLNLCFNLCCSRRGNAHRLFQSFNSFWNVYIYWEVVCCCFDNDVTFWYLF